jgi:hypothetical protein
MGMILNALGVLALGALGWFTLEFVGRPVRGFFDLRRQVRTQMLRFENLNWPEYAFGDPPYGTETKEQAQFRKAQTILCDLSDELISFGQSEWLAAYFVRGLGFDPIRAGIRLAVLAEELGTLHEDRAANYRAVERLLKFTRIAAG